MSYSATPTFIPPTPPVLVSPHNPFGVALEPEPEPEAPADENKDDLPKPEAQASEEAPPIEPGMYADRL